MKTWKTKYTGLFQVRTSAGRLMSVACSVEHAEYTAEKGRGRDIWKWEDQAGKYRHYRTY